MPMKLVKRGYKVWWLSDSNSGYAIKFDIYTGKCKTNSGFTLGERVVVELTKEVCQENTLLAFDRFFTTEINVETLEEGCICMWNCEDQQERIAQNDEGK
jgi:hypothetical protein